MSEVMRFNLIPSGQPNPAANGLYVRHEDYARLEQECERLRKALNAIADCTPDDKARNCAMEALGAKP